MLTLRQYISELKGTTSTASQRRADEPRAAISRVARTHPRYARAKYLSRLYAQAKRQVCGTPRWALTGEVSGGFTVFLELAEWLEFVQQECGIDVDPAEYILAHVRAYGDQAYPQTLVSDVSWSLYCAATEGSAELFVDPESDQEDAIRAIQEGRQCSRQEAEQWFAMAV